MNTTQTQMGDELDIKEYDFKIKEEFGMDEVHDAIENILKAKLVHNWGGSLNLETNGKEIILTQYAGSNSWTKGYTTFYTIEDYHTLSDFITGFDEIDGKLVNQEDENDTTTVEDIFENVSIEDFDIDIDYIIERFEDAKINYQVET